MACARSEITVSFTRSGSSSSSQQNFMRMHYKTFAFKTSSKFKNIHFGVLGTVLL